MNILAEISRPDIYAGIGLLVLIGAAVIAARFARVLYANFLKGYHGKK